MPYTDLLRITVFITGAEATVLGAISAISVGGEPSPTTVIVADRLVGDRAHPRLLAGAPGARPRGHARAARQSQDGDLAALRVARPDRRPAPLADRVTAIIAGGLGLFFPGVAIIGTGYALIVSLAWHTREAAVVAIEERDGVRFFVVPNSALKPIQLVRTPGLRSDRVNSRAS